MGGDRRATEGTAIVQNDIEKVFLEAVDLIQDDNNRRDVRRHVQEGLAAIGQ